MDSLASLDLPAWGYGLHYTLVRFDAAALLPQSFYVTLCPRYGMFKQLIRAGEQKEVPDKWLDEGNPWEITRLACLPAAPPARRAPHTLQAGRRIPCEVLRKR